MNASMPGLLLILVGVSMVVLRRWVARRTVAIYSQVPQFAEKSFAWIAFLGGIGACGVGIAMLLADKPAGLLFVVVGLVSLVFDRSIARWNMAWHRSERVQRVMTVLVGLASLAVGSSMLFLGPK